MKWTKQQYEAIIHENNENILVSAGAGSGKTAILSERVIRKLKDGININQLLILTFTKAASEEMKERIRKKIIDNGLFDQLNLLDSSYITTFDSYALSIVKKFNYLLNLDNNISICDDSILKLARYNIIENILNKKYHSQEKDFLSLVSTFVKKDDKILVEGIESLLDTIDLVIDTNNYFDNFKNHNMIDNYNLCFDLFMNKIRSIQIEIDNRLAYMEDAIENESEEKYVSKCKVHYSKLINAKTYDHFISFIKDSEKLSLPKKDISEEISNAKKEITVLVNEMKEYLIYDSEQFIKENYFNSSNLANVLLKIVEEIYDEFVLYKRKHELYSFTDIAKMAIQIFKENPDIASETMMSLNEIMIDEYQDTSNMQEVFISYISNNNLYMVGDIKQSIYRFRHANPDLFKEKYLNYKKNIGGYLIDLNTNFRSRKEVLENINDIFSGIMTLDYGGADYKHDHLIEYGNKSFLDDDIINQDNNLVIYNYDNNDFIGLTASEIEAFIVANDIDKKLKNNYLVFDPVNKNRIAQYKDFTILVDKRSDFETYKKILESFSIPVTLYQNENIINQDDIYCFNSILKLIYGYSINKYDEEFKHSFYSLAKSYLFSYSDEEILQFIIENNYSNNKIYNSLKEIIDNIKNLSITDLFNEIIKDLHWYEKLIYKSDANASEARLAYLLTLSQTLDKLDYTLLDVITYFKDIIEKDLEIVIPNKGNDANAVKIMTIHNSKGLEFPICYFLGFHNSFNIDETKENFISGENNLILPFIDQNTKYHNLEWYEYKKKYLTEEISEKIRLLYVALTRAKEKMIIPMNLNNETQKYISDSKCFADFMITIKNNLYKYVTQVNKDSLNVNLNYKIPLKRQKLENNFTSFNYQKIINNKKQIETIKYSKAEETQENNDILALGTTLHNLLLQLDFKTPNLDELDNNTKFILNRFLKSSALDIKNCLNVYKEFEFIEENQIGIIDLITEYEHEYRIIDYKLSNIDDDKYIHQLKGYQHYLEQIVDKPIKLYLYSLLKGNFKIIE